MKSRYRTPVALLSMLLAVIVSILPVSAAHAEDDMPFTDFVNSSISVQSNRIALTEEQIKDYVDSHEARISRDYPEYAGRSDRFAADMAALVSSANEKLASGTATITPEGRILPNTVGGPFRAAQFKLEWFWWGTRRTFYSDQQARYFAGDMDRAATVSNIAGLSSLLFPGMAIPTGLSAAYARSVASSVRWAADQPGNGVVLDTKFWLAYTAVPRK